MSARRTFQRPLGKKRYRKLFILAVEGTKTEPQYFAFFNSQEFTIHVNCLNSNHKSSPLQVLSRMKHYLEEQGLAKSDEAWLVVDKDEWTAEQLKQLFDWSCRSDNYGFALSHPNFEYWLLLHFEEGNGIKNASDCSSRLKRYLPGYNKGIDVSRFTREQIEKAIQRAKSRDNPPCIGWPDIAGMTTVYKLVEKLIS